MWKYLLLHSILCFSSLQFQLNDILSATDKFFNEFYLSHGFHLNTSGTQYLKLMLRRTYDLGSEHSTSKRSLHENNYFHDNRGVYMLSNIQDMSRIPVKFPNDINVFSSHNLLYITALEANGTNPENQLSNDLVLFHYSSIQGIKELGRVPVLGGIKVAVHLFQNTTYIVAAEHEAEENPDFYQGSVVYKVVERNRRVFLEKIQILNVIQPNDVKFWEHQDQLYLVIGTNMGHDSRRTGTLIYRWLGYHFDCLQVIPSKNVKSVTPFLIGSFMYLAIANYQDENGNFDIDSEIFEFNLQEMKFKFFQKIKTHGARDFSYFGFEDSASREKEHFLIVANSLGKNSDGSGSLSSLKESVVYKFSDDHFIPFQSFKHQGTTQWLPIQGSGDEFLLLVSHANGVDGYQYDGWRFSPVSLQFGQSFFGNDVQSMRAFYYFGDLFLTTADKSNYGNRINLWKLSFTNRNDLRKYETELEQWCNEMQNNLRKDGFEQVVEKLSSDLGGTHAEENSSDQELKGENHSAKDLNEELRDELDRFNEKINKMEKMLEESEEQIDKYKTESEVPIELGSHEINSFNLSCKTKNCCLFKRVKILRANSENLPHLLSNAHPLSQPLSAPRLHFHAPRLPADLPAPLLNSRPRDALLDLAAPTLLNAHVLLNGTLRPRRPLLLNGLLGGTPPDEQHLLLNKRTQQIQDTIMVNNLKVENLKLFGQLNGEPIETLLRKPNVNILSDYKELNVNEIHVEGSLCGHEVSKMIERALKKKDKMDIERELKLRNLEAEHVQVESSKISNLSVSRIIGAIEGSDCRARSMGNDESLVQAKSTSAETDPKESDKNSETADEYVILVEGVLKAKDLSNEGSSVSLLDIFDSSLTLDQSLIDSDFLFSDVLAEEFDAEVINGVPVSCWVAKESKHVERISGRKAFSENVRIAEEVFAERINNVDLDSLEEDILRLKGDQIVRSHFEFGDIKCRQIKVNLTNFGKNTFDRTNRLELRDSIVADRLEVENLTISGDIDSVSWENILDDFVYEKDFVSGQKRLKGALRAENLNVTGRINDLFFEEFVALTSTDANKIVLDRNITLKKPLGVDELHFEGLLDATLSPTFDREWLLQDETQIVTAPLTFRNVHMRAGSNLMNETVNNVDLRKLFARSLKVNEDAKVRHLYALSRVGALRLDLGGSLNGADFARSVLRGRGRGAQAVHGEWFLEQGLQVNGSLAVEGLLSGLNVTQMCALDPSDKINIIVGGSVTLREEPIILGRVNDLDLSEKAKEVWMRDEGAAIGGRGLELGDVALGGRARLAGRMNSVELGELSRSYLSRSRSTVVSEDLELERLVVGKRCRMRTASVGGLVNGVRLAQWARSVLLQDEEQEVRDRPRFEGFRTGNLRAEGKVNGLNLSTEVLRLDVEDAVVEGEKTFGAINVLNLTLASGKSLQGVFVDNWRRETVKTAGNVLIKGDLTLEKATFKGPIQVIDKVNDIHFDSEHLLTTSGNQIVTAPKKFVYNNYPQQRPLPPIVAKYLEVSGRIGGVDLGALLAEQAYADSNSGSSSSKRIFGAPKIFTSGLVADGLEVRGLFHGVNVSALCDDVFDPVDLNARRDNFLELTDLTESLIKAAKDRAFFFDYFEVIQTLKPNVKAVVPTLHSKGNYLLAMFTPNTMTFLDWNEYSGAFVSTEKELSLTENVTFVASEVSRNNSFLYIETEKSAKIFDPTLLKEIHATDTSCIAFFRLNQLDKWCVFIGQKWNSSRILCNSILMNDLQTYQWLESKGSVQVAALTIDDETFIAAINKEVIFDRIENTLSIYRFDDKFQHFYVSHTLAEINPVALSSVSYKNDHYLVSAGGHLPESVHNSVLSIFRFDKRHKVFVRAQSIQVDTPVDVLFALPPSGQLALYVLTSNPTKPFVVFLHRGVSGFVEETSGLSLYPGARLYSFTDLRDRHFVIISGFGKGQILRAGFKGEKNK